MRFSVIIPCFNASKTIATALDSLINQTYKDFDVVLVDDASTDYLELLSTVNTYNNKLNLKIIRNAENKNGAYSRNRGIDSATGEYVAFLDSDDAWVSDRLESAKTLIETYGLDDFIIYGQFELLQGHATGAVLPLRTMRSNEQVAEYVFAAGQLMQTSTFLCPTHVANAVLFDESLSRHQDSDFMMRAQKKGFLLFYQNKKCAYYQMSSVDFKKRIKSGRIDSDFCVNWLKNKNHFLNDAAKAGYMLSVFARILYLEGEVLRAFSLILASLPRVGLNNLFWLFKSKFSIFYKSKLGL